MIFQLRGIKHWVNNKLTTLWQTNLCLENTFVLIKRVYVYRLVTLGKTVLGSFMDP